MSAYKNVRPMCVNEFKCFIIIPSRIPPYMHHQYFLPLTLEKLNNRHSLPYLNAVTISINPYHILKRLNIEKCFQISEITRMPYLVHRLEKFFQGVIKTTMSIGK